jgi:hypothetical protein
MLDDAVSASSTWFVGVNPDSDAAHVCSHELVTGEEARQETLQRGLGVGHGGAV